MPSDQTINLRSFVAAYLERSGAVVEEAGYEPVEALLDGELSPIFKEHLLLAFDSEVARENPSAILVTYGSAFLDEVAGKAASYGRYTILYGPDPGSKPGGRLEREIQDQVEFVRCRPPKVVHQWLEEHSYRGFYFRAVFRSYERTEGLIAVVVDGHTGLVAPDFAGWWKGVVATEEPQVILPSAKTLHWTGLYQTACRDAKDRPGSAQPPHRPKRQEGSPARWLRSPVTTSNSLQRSPGSWLPPAMRLKSSLAEAVGGCANRPRRREKRYPGALSQEVELYLDHLVEYRLPRLHIRLELQHRNQILNTTLLYNPFAHRLEIPVCPALRPADHPPRPGREKRLLLPEPRRLTKMLPSCRPWPSVPYFMA